MAQPDTAQPDTAQHRGGLTVAEYHKLVGFEGDWRDRWWADDFLSLMAERWQLKTARRVLDVGCGVGHWGQRLAPWFPDAHLFGVDAEPQWIPQAQERAASLGLNATYQAAQAEELPFEADHFDVVVCQTLLMHVAEPVAVLREMCRVLRPGGLVIAAEPNNFANVAFTTMESPRLPYELISALLELHHTLATGKRALGNGDQSVGERLPKDFQRAGLELVDVAMNPQGALLIPPYGPGRGEQYVNMLRESTEQDRLLELGGTEDNMRRLFVAGGGSEERFETLKRLALTVQRERLAAIDAGQLVRTGGVAHYLITGRKP